MGTRSLNSPRCPTCRMLVRLCICPLVRRTETRTRLSVIMQVDEVQRTTNTGRLALLALANSELRVRGKLGEPTGAAELFVPDRRTLLLYPSDTAALLTPELLAEDPRPVTLIVPDATWRQAGRVVRREAALREAPKVKLANGAPSAYRLRRTSREDGLCTIEAIARAMGIMEGPAVEAMLLELFRVFVDRTLWSRGSLKPEDVHGGLPPGAPPGA